MTSHRLSIEITGYGTVGIVAKLDLSGTSSALKVDASIGVGVGEGGSTTSTAPATMVVDFIPASFVNLSCMLRC